MSLDRGWTPFVLLALFALAIRVPFLDLHAYWYDEMLSVLIYGAENDSLGAAISKLGNLSVHPPLYQTALYLWMSAFGTGEFATRMLSSLYMVGGTLFVLGAVKATHDRATGYLAAIIFTLTYLALHYSLETRSYAQTTFLAAASLYFCVRFVVSAAAPFTWRSILLNPNLLAMSLANAGLLLTHYHNGFFIAVQGLYLAGFVAARAGRQWPVALLWLAAVGALPILIYAAIWGPTLVETMARKGIGGSGSKSTPIVPWLMFHRFAYLPNFGRSVQMQYAAWPFLAVALAHPIWQIARRGGTGAGLIYPVMALAPFLLAWVVFAQIGDQKSAARYFIFVTPAIAAWLAIGLSVSLSFIAARLGGMQPRAAALAFLVPVALLIVGPGAYDGLRETKSSYGAANYRDTARLIASAIGKRDRSEYVILEISRRSFLNFYLPRFTSHRSINIHRGAAQTAGFDFLSVPGFAEANYVILAYTHDQIGRDAPLREALGEHAVLVTNMIYGNNRGFRIYQRRK